jgi:drug/metabolite transporter (DMT)-like permease
MISVNKFRIYGILFLAVIIVSTSAIFIRWANDVSSPALAFYRLFISGLILISVSRIRSRKYPDKRFRWHWHYALAGIFLALHFITWIGALKLTSIANAIFIGTTHPFFAVILSIIFLKESPKGNNIPVFVLSLIGIFLIVITDIGLHTRNLAGDALALFSALFFALYILIARLHREKIQIITYLGVVYTIAASVCLIFILIRGDALTGFTDRSWLMIFLLAFGPSLMGHSMLNWASQHIEIFKVNLTMLLEPVLATIAGMLIFLEFPGLNFYPGALLIISAMIFLIYRDNTVERH